MFRNLLAGQHDTQKQRSPPSKPTPVKFPSLEPPEPSINTLPATWTQPGARISEHFLRLKKPSDVSEDTLALLNVTFHPQCDLETLLSSLPNNTESSLPPTSWLESPGGNDATSSPDAPATLLSNGRRLPDQREFYVRARELLFKNADAYSTLTRKSVGDQPQLRLAHFRKFWEGLDNLAYYWDISLDEYLPPAQEAGNVSGEAVVSSTPQASTDAQSQDAKRETDSNRVSTARPGSRTPEEEEPRKKAKVEDAESGQRPAEVQGANGSSAAPVSARVPSNTPNRILPARAAPPKAPWAVNMESQNKVINLSNGSYRGYRIGSGAEMPDQYRIDCVRAFIEPIAWAFGVTLSPHRRPPVLTIEHIRFPVRMSSVGWQAPQDRAKARHGYMEGPVLGVQCRADVGFGLTGNLKKQSNLDAVRELGGLLLLAQERAREGKLERRGGEDRWWTTKERWGGGPGGEVGETTGAIEILSKDAASKPEAKPTDRNRDGSKARRRPSPAEIWKTLRPGNPLWDPKVTYKAIGKDKSAVWDDVFMVSSLNHHISLLKLRIHPAYLEYITEGKLPKEAPTDSDWCSPKLQRTRWFDLFNFDDRTEAMRGIWGVMAYLMRADKTDHADHDGTTTEQ
ncbi:hypothetical protein BKA58DRAFT_445043 [Alternaria rosae]|uniref:uncharacterized protein n=1 Tax=Alternaria rosae TaxID=1187941 RepID=UPI001E8D6BDC|nr:uncharacterized protein BKA58DRAFT_445043 [Alternaria rosae]KAH6851536.1 hypothetical protein BKA58DRAFT_445043 [Alternaria rosae]